jgi:tellurite resistance protein TerC
MSFWLSLGLLAVVLLILVPELLRLRRGSVIGTYEALAWTGFWVTLALAFNVAVYFIYERHWFGLGLEPDGVLDGRTAALQFFTGYIVQKSLSVDNVFVIAMIFAHFRFTLEQQQHLLSRALIGVVVLRGLAILGGAALIDAVSWTAYVFGVLLIFTALRMLAQRGGELRPEDDPLVRLCARRWPLTPRFDGERLLTEQDGRRMATPLLPALLLIGLANLVFALDAVPAILAVTGEPFIVLAAVLFALLGLHSLYFLLASIMHRLHYMKLALVAVLAFVGVKMLLANHHPLPTGLSLAVIATMVGAGVLASVLLPPPPGGKLVSPFAAELEQFVTLTIRSARRIAILVTGSTVMLVGVIMIVTPGPALLVIPAGLAILATEFIWARRLLMRFRQEASSLSSSVRDFIRRRRRGRDGGS